MVGDLQYTLFIIFAPLSAIISTGVIIYAWRAYPTPATTALKWLITAVSGWLVFNTLELVSTSESLTVFWAKFSYFFIVSTPVAWLGFALLYADQQDWLAPQRFVWFCAIPLTTALLAQTNPSHHLIWQRYHFLAIDRLLAMQVDAYGWWFWMHIVYSYALVFLGAFLIGKRYFTSFQLYRRQSIWLVIGALSPIMANLIYIFDLIPGLKKDYTSLSFAFGAIAFAIGMIRYHLFELKPVARDAVIEGMSDAVLTLDMKDRIIDLNPAAQALLEASEGSIIGQPAAHILEPWGTLVERFQNTMNARTDIAIEQASGTSYYDLRISPLIDRRGHPTGRLIVLRDITERKEMEEALRRRTKELEARNADLDAFAHTVAHDLKNPLTGVVGRGHALCKHFTNLPEEEVRKWLDAIVQAGRKMADIIDALLLLANVRQVTDIETKPLDMAAIVDEALARLSDRIAASDAKLIKPQAWPPATGYGPWVEEVWANYISNAIKYGGTPTRVKLGAERVPRAQNSDGDGPMACFWVRDNGPGLTAEQQSKLFSQFTRLDTERAEGHGLGLSIARRIVEKLGGSVGVESEVGQGSTFWFTLPLAEEERAER
jgi:PAS domain S-box-containing protein